MNQRLTFDELPDDAWLKVVPVVEQLSGYKRAKIYRLSKLGEFPPIEKIGRGRSSGIRVGNMRQYLKDTKNYRA